MKDEFLWVEKYRPRVIEDIVLPETIKKQFRSFVEQGNVPNLLLSGSQGTGKTTCAKAVLEELGCDYIVINGSMNGNIDTLRNEILNFAATVSFSGGRKYVILDEADYVTSATQPALRNFTEEYSANCGFIFTCNFPEKIIEPLHSRCTTIDFKISKSESSSLAKQFMKRVKMILETEGVDYDSKVLAEFIMLHFPDWRRILNELQGYGMAGKIDSGILTVSSDAEITKLVSFLKAKDFKSTRKWITESDIDHTVLSRRLYDGMYNTIQGNSIPQLVVLIADYNFKSSFAKDQEINTLAMLVEIMASIDFL